MAKSRQIKLEFEGRAMTIDDVEMYIRNFGSTVRDCKPSMLQDIEAKRPSEIDNINGAVVLPHGKHNQKLAAMVKDIESKF